MQRKEPTLDGASPALDSQLERAPIGRSAYRTPEPEVVEVRSGGAPVLALVALILALAGLGGAAFLYQQWQSSRLALVNAEARIAELEKRFEMSGEESAASVDVLGAKVRENASEIRKLWGVSHDTNRKAIAANTNAIEANKKTLASLSGQVNGMSAQVKKAAEIEKALAELRQANTQKDREVTDKLASLERQLNSVRSDLTARVGATEEAVESMDSYRRTINRDLVQLRDAVRNLQSGGTASAQ